MSIVDREWLGKSGMYQVVYRHYRGELVLGLEVCVCLPSGHPLKGYPISDPRVLSLSHGLSIEKAGYGKQFEVEDRTTWWLIFGGFPPISNAGEDFFSLKNLKHKARFIVSDLEEIHRHSHQNCNAELEEDENNLAFLEDPMDKYFDRNRRGKSKKDELLQ